MILEKQSCGKKVVENTSFYNIMITYLHTLQSVRFVSAVGKASLKRKANESKVTNWQ